MRVPRLDVFSVLPIAQFPPLLWRCVPPVLLILARRAHVAETLPSRPTLRALAGCARVTLTEPLAYPRFLALLRGAWLTLSDSGGVQEEAPCLGAPLLVLRDITERREALASGNARLVGSDGASLLAEVTRLAAEPAERQALASPRALYGDGQASARIVERLERDLEKEG